MFCTKCGATIKEGTKFCVSCGSSLQSSQQGSAEAIQNQQVNYNAPQAPQNRPVNVNVQNHSVVQPVANVQPPEQPSQQPKKKKSKVIGIIIAAILAVALIVGAIIVIPQLSSREETTEKEEVAYNDSAKKDDAEEESEEETTEAPKEYVEADAQEFVESLIDTYNLDCAYECIFATEQTFKNMDVVYFMLGYDSYVLYGDADYNDVIYPNGDTDEDGIAISDMMSEEEFEEYQGTDGMYYVYSVAELQKQVDSIWEPGRFDVTDWDEEDVSVRYITSKSYLTVYEGGRGAGYYTYLTKVKSCTKGENEFTVDAYMLCVSPDFDEDIIIDESTGAWLGNGKNVDDFSSALATAKKKETDLKTIRFNLIVTSEGVRLKSIETPYKTAPDIYMKESKSYTVKAEGGLNLRSSCSTDSTIVYLIPDGSSIYAYGLSNATDDWMYVSYYSKNGTVYGWVNAKYLK